jgi:hypothetical protein
MIKPDEQKIVIDVNNLEELSHIWFIIIPTLGGTPELDINLSLFPPTILPKIENIIRNVGHMEYYELGESETARALIKDHLKPPTSTSRIMEYLQTIPTKEDGVDKGLLPDERVDATIQFLTHLIKWTETEPYYAHTYREFERAEVKKKLKELHEKLIRLQGKQKEQKKAQKRQGVPMRPRSSRLGKIRTE